MKGLVLKELYLIRSFAKQYVLITMMMAGVSVILDNISFVATYIIVLSSSIVMSTTSMDEVVSFNRFAITMPIDTGKLVKSKYVIFFISIMGGAIFIWLFNILITVFLPEKTGAFNMEGMPVIISLFIAANAIAIPVMFKVGAAKARYTYIIVMLIMGITIFGAYHLARMSGKSLDDMLTGMGGMLNLASLSFAAIIVIISYFISVKIVQKKEW